MALPTLSQIYNAYSDSMRDGRDEVSKIVVGTDVDIDHIYCDMISTILDIPCVREAVLIAALRQDRTGGHVFLKSNGLERLDDVPFQFVWDWIMNPEDLGGIEEPST